MEQLSFLRKIFNRNIQTRINIILGLVITTVMIAYAGFNYLTTKSKMESELHYSAEIVANRLSKTLVTPLWNFEKEGVEELLVSEMMDKNIYAILVWEKNEDKLYLGKKRNASWEIVTAEKTVSGEYIQKNKQIRRNNQQIGSVDVFFTPQFMRQSLHQSMVNIILTIIVLNIALLVALYFAIRTNIIGPINRVISGLSNASEKISFMSDEITQDSQELASQTSQQASSLQESSSSMEEMSAMIRQNAKHAKRANSLADDAQDAVSAGNKKMELMEEAIDDVNRSSNETSKIIKTIDEIAFQTNLLALNAAVEAARAGEAGQGFAVVADEVRNLSQRAAEAAHETSELIEGSIQHTKRSVNIAGEVADSLGTINDQISEMNNLVSEISAASEEQSRGIDQLNSGIADIDQVTQANALSAEESADTAEQLSSLAHDLQESVHALLRLTGKEAYSENNGQQTDFSGRKDTNPGPYSEGQNDSGPQTREREPSRDSISQES